MNCLRRFLSTALRTWFRGRLSTTQPDDLVAWLTGVVRERCVGLPPRDSLKFLFDLDAQLYELEGLYACRFGDGLHVKHRLTGYHDFFVERVSQGERVLDVGCGLGALAYDVADRCGARVTGVDISAQSLTQARERFQHPLVEYMMCDVSARLPDGPFDCVLLSNVLEHLQNRVAILVQIRKATGAKKLLVRVPLLERDWRVPLRRELGVEWRLDRTHETEYSLEEFEQELRAGGWRILEQTVKWGEIWAQAERV